MRGGLGGARYVDFYNLNSFFGIYQVQLQPQLQGTHEVEVNHGSLKESLPNHRQIVRQLERFQNALKPELMACLGDKK